jgi:hypothetical protein
MPDANAWRDQAARLRESARDNSDEETRRALLMLAADCDEIAEGLTKGNVPLG